MNKENKVLEYVERFGIIEYKVKGNVITWYEKHSIDCFGNKRKYKYTHNVSTGFDSVKELYKRN